jgi:two-component system chemotaxis response regulator CheB
MADNRIVVIGASRGGVNALKALASMLPANFPAPVLVVLHIGDLPSVLPQILSRAGPLPARHALDREPLANGTIVIAPPDRHLLVEDGLAVLLQGPKEHHARPAIDPLFVSAALAHGPRVIGVLLTGSGDDGTYGLQAIKQCGGMAIVQHPNSAEAPAMPLAAVRHVSVDHIVDLERIAPMLGTLIEEPPPSPAALAPEALAHEFDVFKGKGDAMENLKAIGKPSTFVCPDCHGALWEIDGSDPARYRCHVGHGFSLNSLLGAQGEATDSALWAAIRAMQERSIMLEKLARLHREADPRRCREIEEAASAMEHQSHALRRMVEARAPGAS